MSISTFSSLKSKIVGPWQTMPFTKNSVSAGGSAIAATTFYVAPNASTTSPTSGSYTSATDGASHLGLLNASTTMRIASCEFGAAQNSFGTWVLVDRLAGVCGYSGTTTGAQSGTFYAPTRYTDGVGVWLIVEIAQQIGTSATTYTVSYTNQDSTSGRTSQATAIGGTARRNAGVCIVTPLAEGDTGVKEIASLTLAGSTGTAGYFNTILVKPLLFMPVAYSGMPIAINTLLSQGVLPQVQSDACLQWICLIGNANNQTGAQAATVKIVAE